MGNFFNTDRFIDKLFAGFFFFSFASIIIALIVMGTYLLFAHFGFMWLIGLGLVFLISYIIGSIIYRY